MTAPVEPEDPSNLFTPFLPSTYTVPEEQDRMRVFLSDTFSQLSDVINDKKIGTYTQETEALNGTVWIYDTTKKVRNGYQCISRINSWQSTTIPMPIPNINPQFIITQAYGSASKPCSSVGAGDGDYFSFFSEGNSRIQFTMSDTQIVITAPGMSAYNGFLVIEYIRDGT